MHLNLRRHMDWIVAILEKRRAGGGASRQSGSAWRHVARPAHAPVWSREAAENRSLCSRWLCFVIIKLGHTQ